MNLIFGRGRAGSIVAVILLTLAPDLLAAGGKGGRGGGGGRSGASHPAFRQAAPSRSSYRPPKAMYRAPMPRVATPRRVAAARPAVRRPSTSANLNIKRTTPRSAANTTKVNTLNRSVTATRSATLPRTATLSSSAARRYTNNRSRYYYAQRAGVRRIRGYGYSRRYAVSNQNTRAIVQRLRSTHASLARLDHDYQGHRVRAMRSIQMAIRQLAHSRGSRYGYASNGMNGRNGFNNRNRVGFAGNQRLPQAQSDARMRRAGQTLQAVNMQMSRNTNSSNRMYAQRHVQNAMREIAVALQVR